MADSYPKFPRSTVNRLKARGRYDYETIHTIVNTCPVVHVSFLTPDPEDPFPALLPMLGFMGSFYKPDASLSEPMDLYLHGYISSRLMKLGGSSDGEGEGLPLTIAATHFDGIVLALTPNHHSYNYRSAILHGYAMPVTSVDEKLWALEKITNGVLATRWENSRLPPTNAEMTSTQILKVKIVDASAKVRDGGPNDDHADLKNAELRERVWTGVVPTWTAYGEPVAAVGDKKGNLCKEVPKYILDYVKNENESREKLAVNAIQGSD